jgi:L-2-hydroxyglutarate oxidase LhgO
MSNNKLPNQSDIVIVGAGIVGLAVARELALRYPDLSLTVLDKEAQVGTHQTGHNSGVIHRGIYYRPGTLKATLCVEGANLLTEYADSKKITYRLCGKVIAAVTTDETSRLETLWQRGFANKVPGLSRLTGEQVREIEPNAKAVAGIYSEYSGIIDFADVARSLARDVTAAGKAIVTGAQAKKLRKVGAENVLETTRGSVTFGTLINCAGLHADTVAKALGANPGVRIVPFRGEYYILRDSGGHLVRHLLYPVPDPNYPFLGVHFTRMVSGELKVGPNAVLALSREGYQRSDFSFMDTAGLFAYPGFWMMAAKNWKVGLAEMKLSRSPSEYTRALQQLVPKIKQTDLGMYRSGVRAQCVAPNGSLIDDFHIVRKDWCIHVLNVPSPAATACLAIARHIAESLIDTLGNPKNDE